jgi:carbamoyl-phosphate synthase large subunit
VLEVVAAEQESAAQGGGELVGVLVQLGGQTPLRLAQELKDAGVPIVGTSPEAIHLAEDRGAFGDVLEAAGLPAPRYGLATSYDEAKAIAERVGYPVLVRPRTSWAGAGMEIVYTDDMLVDYVSRSTHIGPDAPVLVDRFLEDAVEVDVDALYDGTTSTWPGSWSTSRRPGSTPATRPARCRRSRSAGPTWPRSAAAPWASPPGVGVRGLLNVQYAVKDDVLYVLEANPRASRTVPFVSKATAVQVAKAARGSCSGRPSPSCAPRGAAGRRRRRRPAVRRADLGQGGGAAVRPLPHRRR